MTTANTNSIVIFFISPPPVSVFILDRQFLTILDSFIRYGHGMPCPTSALPVFWFDND